jgi:hypothetical protein
MKSFIFYARNRKTGESFTFTFDDLYGYEGEECGVFIHGSGIALNYNSGYGDDGMNPDLDIYDVKVTDR